MTAGSWAWAGLGLYVAGVVVAFGVRAVLYRRATGSSGFRGLSGRPGSLVWWGGLLFPVSLLVELVGLAAAALGVGPGSVWPPDQVVPAVGLAIAVVGLVVTVQAQGGMGSSWRIGVDAAERTPLVVDGPFRRVRNPIFTGMVAVSAGVALMAPTALTVAAFVCLVVAVEVQVRAVEEPYLAGVHGDAYAAYTARAGRFLPGIGRFRPEPAHADDGNGI